jgi:intracellular sulfur oxidation DsrE/DsrF family protein
MDSMKRKFRHPVRHKRVKAINNGKGEIDPLSSVLVTRLRYDSQVEDNGLPLASDLKLQSDEHKGDYTLLVGADVMGRDNEELGKELMRKFFRALLHQSQVPLHIVFLNGGALLVKEDSSINRQLVALKEMGCALHVDQTSLTCYDIKVENCLATPINSIGLAQLMVESPKVITLP